MIFPGLGTIDASVDVFAAMPNDNSAPWSIQADASAVSGGAPTYAVMVSNKGPLEADAVVLRPAMSAVPLADVVSDAFLAFKYVGIKYTAAGATGTTTFYINFTPEKTVLS